MEILRFAQDDVSKGQTVPTFSFITKGVVMHRFILSGLLASALIGPALAESTELPLLGKTMTQARQQQISPREALDKLISGNRRFVSGQVFNRNYLQQAKMSSYGQFPFAVILNCMDSRSIPEMIFDQGIADIFTLRVAGNVLNEDILGSMEFGTKATGARLIVVMGHTSCGAMAGACQKAELGHLNHVLDKIEPLVPAVKKSMPDKGCTDMELVDAIALANAKHVAQSITQQSKIIKELVASGKLQVVVAMHDIRTGQVQFSQP